MQINNSQKPYSPIQYQGLTRTLSRHTFSNANIKQLKDFYQHSNGIVGSVPQEWVQNMPYNTRRDNIQQLYNDFGHFVTSILSSKRHQKSLNKYLTRILQNCKAIESDASVTISKIGEGDFGIGYKITNTKTKKSIFLKKFIISKDNEIYTLHGTYPEINAKALVKREAKKNSEKASFPHFYFGDLNKNYYLEEFCQPENQIPGLNIEFNQRRELLRKLQRFFTIRNHFHNDLNYRNVIFYSDKNNTIKTICFDLGGVEYLPFDDLI